MCRLRARVKGGRGGAQDGGRGKRRGGEGGVDSQDDAEVNLPPQKNTGGRNLEGGEEGPGDRAQRARAGGGSREGREIQGTREKGREENEEGEI